MSYALQSMHMSYALQSINYERATEQSAARS